MDNYIQDPFFAMLVPFYGELYVFYYMGSIDWIWILYVVSHDASNALFLHVIPHHRKSFSEKQEVFLRNKSGHVW